MTVRATRKIENAIVERFLVPANKTTTANLAVKFSGADNAVELATAGDDAIGIAKTSQVAGDYVDVIMFCHSIIPVVVGTGGATRGLPAIQNTDGYIDRALGGGTTQRNIAGRFRESGVVGDVVGLMVGGAFETVSS